MGRVALARGQLLECLSVAHHNELPRLAVSRAARPASHLEHAFQNLRGHGPLLEGAYGPKRLQEADQHRRVGITVRTSLGHRLLACWVVHLPLPLSFWEV